MVNRQIDPLSIMNYIPKKAMVDFAHPDDAEIGAGGSAALWALNGCEITYIQCTDGSNGSNDEKMTSQNITKIRSEEQKEAAKLIGVRNYIHFNYMDGGLIDNKEFLSQMVEVIRKYRPEVIFTHDPFRIDGFQHRDHRITGIIVQDAVYPFSRDHLHFPEQIKKGLKTHKVKSVLYWGADKPNCIIDISNSIETKIESLSKHQSQLPGLSYGSETAKRIRNRSSDSAQKHDFKYGEVFRKLDARV